MFRKSLIFKIWWLQIPGDSWRGVFGYYSGGPEIENTEFSAVGVAVGVGWPMIIGSSQDYLIFLGAISSVVNIFVKISPNINDKSVFPPDYENAGKCSRNIMQN